MNTYIFTSTNNEIVAGYPQNQKTTMKFEAETLDELVEGFRAFVLANGFSETSFEKFFGG